MTKSNPEFENIRKSLILIREGINQQTSVAGYEETLKNLDRIIDGMELSPLSRISNYWSELTFWQKLLGGITITSLPLTLSAVVNFSFCMTLAGLNAVTYTVSGMLLAEHNQTEKCNQNRFISGAKDFIFFTSKQLDIPLEDLNYEKDAIANSHVY